MAAKRATKTHADDRTGIMPFLPPWLLVVVLLVTGHVLHVQLGPDSPNPRWVPIVACLFIYTATLTLAGITFRYAMPRGPVICTHATATVAVSGLLLVLLVIVGVSWPTFWLTAGVGVVAALSWNIRRLQTIRGEGNDGTDKGALGELGIKPPRRSRVIESTAQRTEVAIDLAPGQTVGDVQKVKDQLASHIGAARPVIRGSARAVPGEYEGQVTYSVSHVDLLKDTVHYPGPEFPPTLEHRASIADGLRYGVYEDGQPQKIWPAGNYAKNIAPGVTAIGGMTRSGKGEAMIDLVAELATRRDVVITLSDTRKAEQFLGEVRQAIRLYFDSNGGVKAYLRALERAGTERNRAIGAAGYKAWRPECFDDETTPNGLPGLRMPAVVAILEESAAVLDNNASLIVELGEFLLSAGVFLVVSQQRWTHDRAPTSFRSSIGIAMCFGVQGDADAGCIIDDDVLAVGPNPSQWKNYFPGRNLVTGPGIDRQRFPVPGKAYLGGERAKAVIAEWGPRMADLDPVTVAAFGPDVMACVPPAPPAGAVVVPAQTRAVEIDEDDDDDHEYEPTEEEAAMFTVPTSGDAELDTEMRGVDPRADLPGWSGDDVDLTPDDDGMPELDKDGKFAAFGRVLEQLMDAGAHEVTTSDLREAYVALVGERNALRGDWFLHEMIGDYIDGAHAGQIERAHRGKYRLVTLASVTR